jgi:transposase
MRLPRFFNFENYEVKDLKEFLSESRIEVFLVRKSNSRRLCHKCGEALSSIARGDHFLRVEALPILGNKCFLVFRRHKFHCDHCKKARSERVDFLSEHTPHLTKDFSWWLGRMCEIAAVSRVAEFNGQDGYTTWRLDYAHMITMLSRYRIKPPRAISVDEVYARKRKPGETEEDCYFTVVSDLETRKVVWVSMGRSKKSLDEFFKILGEESSGKIEVVATDQHEPYGASVREHAPQATVVWDRFHILQNFENVVNETRMDLHERTPPNLKARGLTRSKNKYIFLKKASRRTAVESRLIEDVMKDNESFYRLEIIKERMLSLFDEPTAERALFVWTEIGDWIKRSQFIHLSRWYETMSKKWDRIAAYFEFRVTTSLSEGINNVIKAVKRRAYGYRNMNYFRLKIMQVMGYLNSRFIPTSDQLLALI